MYSGLEVVLTWPLSITSAKRKITPNKQQYQQQQKQLLEISGL